MPWLFFAALFAAGAYYYETTKKKAPAHRAPAPVAHQQIPADPAFGQVQDFFGQARSVTRQFQQGSQEVAQSADDVSRTAIAASGAVASIAGAIGSLAKVMPGVFKDLGIDGPPTQKQTPQPLHLSFGDDAQTGDQKDLHLSFGDGADQAASNGDEGSLGLSFGGGSGGNGGIFGNLGLSFGDDSAEAGNDLGVDTSSTDNAGGYPNNFFPIGSGTAGTSADGVTPDDTINYANSFAPPVPDMTTSPQQFGGGDIPDPSENNADYDTSWDAWGEA